MRATMTWRHGAPRSFNEAWYGWANASRTLAVAALREIGEALVRTSKAALLDRQGPAALARRLGRHF